ncbi:MAG: peptidoglycan-binding protein, partial [Rhodobacteraceae bacterium]|nr:peptidoglycan-binding protein [Paracoccaceae bacterium]
MQTVTDIAREIVAREGGYVNDPDDPGGATKYGVTIHTMRRLGLDLTGDGRVTPADVQRLTRENAVEIFVEHYWRAPRISELPEVLQPSVFDMYVNAGANAVKVLQRLLAEMGQEIVADGVLGPRTIAAAHAAERAAPDLIADAYGIAR